MPPLRELVIGFGDSGYVALYRYEPAEEITALKADIDKGLADVAAGRVAELNGDRIIERGRKLLAARKSSA